MVRKKVRKQSRERHKEQHAGQEITETKYEGRNIKKGRKRKG